MNYTCQTTKTEMTRVKMSTERSFETDFRLFYLQDTFTTLPDTLKTCTKTI